VPLTTLDRVVCAAPSFWEKHGRPKVPADLTRLDCLVYTIGSDAGEWRFDGRDGSHRVRVSGSFRADNSLLIVDALLRGVGVSLVPRVFVAAELAAGRLQAVLGDYATASGDLYAVYPSRQHLPQRVRAFVGFLRSRLRDDASAAQRKPGRRVVRRH
jgi:DNA-binding transcriptional LysR family regulator